MTAVQSLSSYPNQQNHSCTIFGLRGRAFLVSAKGFVPTPKPLHVAKTEATNRNPKPTAMVAVILKLMMTRMSKLWTLVGSLL